VFCLNLNKFEYQIEQFTPRILHVELFWLNKINNTNNS